MSAAARSWKNILLSLCAPVLQLRDDGDQVLETKEVAAVQPLVHHAFPLEMSASGVGEIYHPYVHHRVRTGGVGLADTRTPSAAAVVAGGGRAVRETQRARYFTHHLRLIFLSLWFSLCLLLFLLSFRDAVLGLLAPALAGGRAIVDYEQGAGVEAVGFAGFQGGLHVSEPAQHRGQELTSQAVSAVEELE